MLPTVIVDRWLLPEVKHLEAHARVGGAKLLVMREGNSAGSLRDLEGGDILVVVAHKVTLGLFVFPEKGLVVESFENVISVPVKLVLDGDVALVL